MELRLLRYFLAVAETEHFGRAADQLHMAAPPLSRAIRQLEHEVGAQLFTRDTRQVRLTEAGRVLQREASLALAGLEDTVDRVRRIGAGKVGVIRLGVTGSATYGVLPQLARAIKERLPGVALRIETEMLTPAQADALRNNRLDLGVLRTPLPENGLASRTIADEPLVLALPSTHPLASRENLTVSDLRDEPFITYDPAVGSVVDDAVVRTCATAGFSPRREHLVAETATVIALVAAGLGVALVPDSARALTLTGVTFRDLPDTEHVTLALAWRTDDDSPVLANALAALNDLTVLTQSTDQENA